MHKYPILLQDEEKACGAYCIAMIFKYYGYTVEMKDIKKKSRLNHNGISIKGIIECFKDYQIEATAYEATLQDIREHLKCPCILYMVYDNIGHFVVLYEIKDDEYIIGDPARGLLTIYEEEMNEHYARRVVAIMHVGRVPTLQKQTYPLFLKKIFFSYRKQMVSCLWKGIGISLLGYGGSYFFQWMIDDIHQETHFFYLAMMCFTYGFVELMKTRLEKLKNQSWIHLQRALDEDIVFDSSMNMLKLSHLFFYQDKGYIQSELLALFDLSEMSLSYFERVFLDVISFVVFVIGMLIINVYMTMIVMIMLICIGFLSYHQLKQLESIHKNYLEAHYVFGHHLIELIENQFLIQRFSLYQRQRERSYDIYMQDAVYKEKRALFLNQMQSRTQYMIYIFYMIILLGGFYFYQKQYLSLGQLMMFYMLVSYCIQPVMNMISLLVDYQQMTLIYEKYKLFEKEETVIKEDLHDSITSITFDNVSYAFGYQQPIFEHIDWHIDHHYLLKGVTGSGKSTLLKLLLGCDLEYNGDIYINDQELRTIELSSLYQHMGYTNETPTFLHMTLFDNFLCSDQEKIEQYLKAFGVLELKELYHIVLSEDGSPLSLGQRQVVALVRLLCQNHDVLILDEAFSHMDTRLARKIIRYLLKNDEGKIYIMVNHQTKMMNKGLGCAIIEKGKLTDKG